MPPVYNDLLSILPSFSSPPVEPLPEVGSAAPALPIDRNFNAGPTLVAFVRHCGCPYAEYEVRELAKLSAKHPDLHCVVVSHSREEVAKRWFERVGGNEFESGRVTLVPDPDRKVYAAWGVGQLSITGVFGWEVISNLSKMKNKGIVNTVTEEGSNRYQNSGGFAVDKDGRVAWVHVARVASDTSDFDEAVTKLHL